MKTKSFLILFLFVVTFHFKATAQTQFNGWVASFNTIKTGKKTSIHADAQLRSTDAIQQIQTVLLRTGLNYQVNKKIIFTAGYAFISNKKIVGDLAGHKAEHRLWEQVIVSHNIKKLTTSHRGRIEQRFIGKTKVLGNTLSDGPTYANRFRYFIRNVLPLTKGPVFKKGVFVAIQNEVFLNFGNTETVNGKTFDQNRFYLATGYRLNGKTDLEIGYMNQYVNGRGHQFSNNHIIQLAAYMKW